MPVNGHVSERSPPLSLVNTTIVLPDSPRASSLQYPANLAIHRLTMRAYVSCVPPAVAQAGPVQPIRLRLVARRLSQWRVEMQAEQERTPIRACRLIVSTARSPSRSVM